MSAKRLIIVITAAAFPVFTAGAQDLGNPPPNNPPAYPPDNAPTPEQPTPHGLFQANEWTLDLFGTASVNEEILKNISGDRVTRNGRLGAGGGLTYFLTRYVGIGGDAYTENTAHSFIDNTSGNLYLRLPFDGVHLAPYIYGGAGYQFDPGEAWFGQAGAGLDIRLTHHFGLFVDGRYVLPSRHEENFGVGRAGIRLIF